MYARLLYTSNNALSAAAAASATADGETIEKDARALAHHSLDDVQNDDLNSERASTHHIWRRVRARTDVCG